MTLSERVKLALHNKDMSQAELARQLGVTKAAVNAWIKNRSDSVKSNHLIKAAEILDVNADWLGSGVGEMKSKSITAVEPTEPVSEDYFMIPEYEVKFSAGDSINPEPVFTELTEGNKAIYRRSFFEKKNVNPQNCMRFRVDGHSMEPFLWDQDVITVDTHEGQTISDGKVYIYSLNKNVKVKRLSTRANGDIVVQSFNPEYEDDVITKEQQKNFRLIGRVIDRSGSGEL